TQEHSTVFTIGGVNHIDERLDIQLILTLGQNLPNGCFGSLSISQPREQPIGVVFCAFDKHPGNACRYLGIRMRQVAQERIEGFIVQQSRQQLFNNLRVRCTAQGFHALGERWPPDLLEPREGLHRLGTGRARGGEQDGKRVSHLLAIEQAHTYAPSGLLCDCDNLQEERTDHSIHTDCLITEKTFILLKGIVGKITWLRKSKTYRLAEKMRGFHLEKATKIPSSCRLFEQRNQ